MAYRQRTIAVIGLGTFGKAVARELTRVGDRVLGIDINSKRVADLADEIDSTLQADTTDIKALRQCGLESFDSVVVSIGRVMDASILTALNILELGFNNVWVKAQSSTHEKILKAIGVTNIIQPESEYGFRLAQIIHNPLVKDYLSLNSDVFIVQMAVPHSLIGQKLESLKLRKKFNVRCAGIVCDDEVRVNNCERHLLENGEDILIVGTRADIRHFANSL